MPEASSLVESITQSFDDDTYSDLIVKCGIKAWKVHRVVVCSQSKVLHAACMTGFKEAQTGVIDLEDDDPAAVEVMLKFFYTSTYNEVINQNSELSDTMRYHILVYNLADKFDVPALMNLAEKRFHSSFNRIFNNATYFSIISDLYTLPAPDEALKSIAVAYARECFRGMSRGPESDLLEATLRQIPEFAIDLLLRFIRIPLQGHCSSCGSTQTAEALQARCVKCKKGGVSSLH